MGTILWQLNDCWPVASWSITDYYNRQPKAAWYAVKEAYRDDVKPIVDLTRPINLKLDNPKITFKVIEKKIVIKSNKDAKYVWIDINGYTGKLSENYFDLKAGEQKTISIESPISKPKITVTSLYDVLRRNK
jgi:beta-mannosidase